MKPVKLIAGNDGWTFMETIIVIAIILILSSSVGYVAVRNIPKSRIATTKSQIDSFMVALESYYIDCGTYPTKEQGLDALWKKPETGSAGEKWSGPYLVKKVPKDPWGHDYVYNNPGTEGFPYSIISYGEDGKEGGEGNDADITSWND
jgi:general secretion pathway protein G